MIARLRGTLIEASYTEAVVECAGVGYAVNIPLCTFEKLPRPGGEVTLNTVLFVREDDMSLYGFATMPELRLFKLLNKVNGIGAKTALAILSSLNISAFCQAILSADIRTLKKINGVGPKSAERMIVELRDKIKEISPTAGFTSGGEPAAVRSKELDDALMALEKLGFSRLKIEEPLQKLVESLPESERSTGNIIRKALQSINRS